MKPLKMQRTQAMFHVNTVNPSPKRKQNILEKARITVMRNGLIKAVNLVKPVITRVLQTHFPKVLKKIPFTQKAIIIVVLHMQKQANTIRQ